MMKEAARLGEACVQPRCSLYLRSLACEKEDLGRKRRIFFVLKTPSNLALRNKYFQLFLIVSLSHSISFIFSPFYLVKPRDFQQSHFKLFRTTLQSSFTLPQQ